MAANIDPKHVIQFARPPIYIPLQEMVIATNPNPDLYGCSTIRVEGTLKWQQWERAIRETTTHNEMTQYVVLSLSGVVRRFGAGTAWGQISGEIVEAIRGTSDVKWHNGFSLDRAMNLVTIWDRWHLNHMRAGCVHCPAEHDSPCPYGYKWGSRWLFEPIPVTVIDEIAGMWGVNSLNDPKYNELRKHAMTIYDLGSRPNGLSRRKKE